MSVTCFGPGLKTVSQGRGAGAGVDDGCPSTCPRAFTCLLVQCLPQNSSPTGCADAWPALLVSYRPLGSMHRLRKKGNRVLKIIPSSRRIGAGPPERKGPPRHGVRSNIHCSAAKHASATSSRSSAFRALKGRGSGPVSATITGGRPTGIAVTRNTLLHGLSGSGRVGVKPLRA